MRIHAIGGYNEVGKNMTALEIGDDVILFDAGLFLPAIVGVTERERVPTEKGMRALGALPDDIYLEKHELRNKVIALLVSHAHLDHVGGVPYIAPRYNADVVGTPFTVELLKLLMEDAGHKIPNHIKSVPVNGTYIARGRKSYKIELINMTHSTIQSAIIAVHTPEGVVLYANDYKLDNSPVFGDKPNYKRLKELAHQGVKALIVDCLYAPDDRKTPSEKIAKGLLEDVFLTTDNSRSGMVVTTFSSHIARLKTITELGRQLHREVLFFGRSLNKYVTAAQRVGKAPFRHQMRLFTYRRQVEKMLKIANKQKSKYLIVCTGHQGEPGSILDRMARHQLPYQFTPDDQIIFSSKTIPTPVNEANKQEMEKRLKKHGVRIFDNVHVSVLPDTEVVINDSQGVKIKEISAIMEIEKNELKVPAFDPTDLKIKWYDAQVVRHPYNGKIFCITTKSGRSVSITSGHSLFKLEKGRIVTEKGDNLRLGDFLAIPKKFSWYKTIEDINVDDYLQLQNAHLHRKDGLLFYDSIQLCSINIKLTKKFSRLLGYYLAEGSAPRHISLVIGKKEEDLRREIEEAIRSCFPSQIHTSERGNAFEITFGARTLGKLFKAWFGENARTKHIPKFVFSASEEFKLNFLGAYLNGDGTIDKGTDHFRIRMKTASKKLASDLLYLLAQVGVCAKFDHVQIDKERRIAGNLNPTLETRSYVIRIQGIDSLAKLKNFLSDKFRLQIEDKISTTKFSQQFPPESLPIEKLELSEIEPRKDTYLHDIKHYREHSKNKKQHISRALLSEQALEIRGFTRQLIEGDLLFDPITNIEISNYDGNVYDFTVPGPENFIGGFGGIMLHNSGHGGREDLRDLIKLTKPEHVIPSHGDLKKLSAGASLAEEIGYKLNKTVHLLQNGKAVEL